MPRSPRHSTRRTSVADRILAFNNDRESERLALKYAAMRRDPFVFLRGTAHLFYEDWVATVRSGPLAAAPRGWICGDLHLENFGTFHGQNGLVYFDVNDFDEAALGPATMDLARYIASLHLAADQLGLDRGIVRTLAANFLASYTQALRHGKPFWLERATARGAIRRLLKNVKSRSRRSLIEARTVDGRCERLALDGRRYMRVSDGDRAMVVRDVGVFANAVGRPDFFHVLDVARRVAGTGSLGVARYAVLVRGADQSTPRLLDLKEARPSVAAKAAKSVGIPTRRWGSEAERVTLVQRASQAVTPALLASVTCCGRSSILRSLQPSEDRLSLEDLAARPKRLLHAIESMALVTAWLHLRTAGRWGASTVEQWEEWASDPTWALGVARFSERYARQVGRDWSDYSAVFDAGGFATG